MNVRVFRNLTSRCYSVQAQVFNDRNRLVWRTVAHADSVVLTNARFRVSEAGRQRVLRTGKKTVHAWISGTLVARSGLCRAPAHRDTDVMVALAGAQLLPPSGPWDDDLSAHVVTYNPRFWSSFVRASDAAPIYTAREVFMRPRSVLARLEA